MLLYLLNSGRQWLFLFKTNQGLVGNCPSVLHVLLKNAFYFSNLIWSLLLRNTVLNLCKGWWMVLQKPWVLWNFHQISQVLQSRFPSGYVSPILSVCRKALSQSILFQGYLKNSWSIDLLIDLMTSASLRTCLKLAFKSLWSFGLKISRPSKKNTNLTFSQSLTFYHSPALL